MNKQPGETQGLPTLPKAIVLLLLAGISCFVVWSFNFSDLLGFLVSLLVGSFLGCLVGGLVGVHLFPTLATMSAFGIFVECIVLGSYYYGWSGAFIGGLIGIVAAAPFIIVPMMLIHLLLIFGGMYPFTNYGLSEEKQNELP